MAWLCLELSEIIQARWKSTSPERTVLFVQSQHIPGPGWREGPVCCLLDKPQWPLFGDVDGICLEDCEEKMPGFGLLGMVASGVSVPTKHKDMKGQQPALLSCPPTMLQESKGLMNSPLIYTAFNLATQPLHCPSLLLPGAIFYDPLPGVTEHRHLRQGCLLSRQVMGSGQRAHNLQHPKAVPSWRLQEIFGGLSQC